MAAMIVSAALSTSVAGQAFKLGGAPPKDLPAHPATKPAEAATEPAAPAPEVLAPPTVEEAKPAPASAEKPAGTPTPEVKPDGTTPVVEPKPLEFKPLPDPKAVATDVPSAGDSTKAKGAVAGGPTSQPAGGEPAFTLAEFPPGLFTDGGTYKLNECRGKAIVLFFYDPRDPRMQVTVPQRNALVRRFAGKPVVFFGVHAETLSTARFVAAELGLAMPVFADTLGVMHGRYRAGLSASKTWGVVIIDGAGKVAHAEMTEESISKALEKSRATFRDRQAFEPKLAPAMDLLEAGEYDRAMKAVAALTYGPDRKTVDSARQFQLMVRAECDVWKAEADRLAATDALAAYDLYARIAACFPNSDLSRTVSDPMKKLEARKEVKAELSARAMYAALSAAVSRDERVEKWDAVDYVDQIVRAHPGTPTADRLVAYLDDLGKVKERFSPKKRGLGRAAGH
ncbi:MAG TPA: redoxin domain-containing protein [Tepidisphaeraceae bacterium]|nr:redoxin domain-containing protein [Tepidisphaeraceae bacterium]